MTARVSFVRKGHTYVRLPEHLGYPCPIEINSDVQSGEPVIRGTRIPASTIAFAAMSDQMGIAYTSEAWGITRGQVQACIDYINAPEVKRRSNEHAETQGSHMPSVWPRMANQGGAYGLPQVP